MPRGIHRDAEHLHDILDKAVLLIEDGVQGDSVDLNDPSPVYAAIVVDVSGYGPHVGAMYAYQNRFYGNPDTPLQEAYQILEEWTLEHYPEHFEELEKEWGDEALSILTETFDGWAFQLSPDDFVRAIRGTDAERFIDVEPEEGSENLEEAQRGDPWRGQPRRPPLPDMRLIDGLAAEVDRIRRERRLTFEQAYDAISPKPDWFRRYYMGGGDKIYLENLIINRAKQIGRQRRPGVSEGEGFAGDPPTAKNILEWLGPYMEHEGLDAPRESARLARLIANARTNRQADEVLEEANRVIGGHGVEAIQIEGAYVDNYHFDIVATYVNMGDTYNATLLYETANRRFVLTTWGDWFEANEREYLPEGEDLDEARRRRRRR